MDLYLIRHAIAFEHDPERWPDDSKRPLTQEGEERYRAAVRGFREIVPMVEVHFSSAFTRAWQTAEVLQEEAGWPAPQALEELESGREPHETLKALSSWSSAGSLALVGHEPHLHEFAAYLLSGEPGRVPLKMKKGGVAHLHLEELIPGCGVLRWLLTPKILRALGKS